MKVLFLKNIKGVAQIGDIKDVSDGYARNFLLPNKLATAATGDSLKQAETLKNKRKTQIIEDQRHAEAMMEKLKDATVELIESANSEGHLYGSVDEKQIADAIKKAYHLALSIDQIKLPHHLKTTGDHQVTIQLFQTIATTLTVRVLPS